MRNHKIIAIILVCLLMCSLTACGREPIKIVPKDTTGTIETAEGIFIDSESMTLTFGQGSYVICGEDRYDVSGTAATLNLPVAQGVYLIQVIGDKATRTEKVVLR